MKKDEYRDEMNKYGLSDEKKHRFAEQMNQHQDPMSIPIPMPVTMTNDNEDIMSEPYIPADAGVPMPARRRSPFPAIGIAGGALAACLVLVMIGKTLAGLTVAPPTSGEEGGTTTSTAYFDETVSTEVTNAPIPSDADASDKNNMTDTEQTIPTYPTTASHQTAGLTQPTARQTTPTTVPPTICPPYESPHELFVILPSDATRQQIIETFMKLDCIYAIVEHKFAVYYFPNMEYTAATNTIRWKWVQGHMLIADYNLGVMRLEYGNEVLAEKPLNTCHTAAEAWDMFREYKNDNLLYTISRSDVEKIMNDGWVAPFIMDANTVIPKTHAKAMVESAQDIYVYEFYFKDGGPIFFLENYTLKTMTCLIGIKQYEDSSEVPLNPAATPYLETYH